MHINLGCGVDFDIAGPSIQGTLVLGYEGWLAGYQMNFETSKSLVTQSNLTVVYKNSSFIRHLPEGEQEVGDGRQSCLDCRKQ